MAASSSSASLFGFREEDPNPMNQQQHSLPPSSSTATPAAAPAPKKKRNQPGTPNPDAEVIALSPKTLMATNRFICEVCNKGFQREQNLQLHRRGHNLPWKLKQKTTKEPKRKVYLCPEPTCVHHDPSRALGDLTGIKKHYSRKHGEKKWKCDKCSKKYAVQSDWKAHSKTCGTREYRCDCGTLFSRRDSFITHRAFCDALAQEGPRQPPISLTGAIGSHLYGSSSTLTLIESKSLIGAMNVDHDQPPPTATATAALQTLTSGPLSSSVASLAASSRCIPSERDFFFYRNFNEFKLPIDEISRESQSMLEAIGVASNSPFPGDLDDGYDWLVNVNDDVLERFDVANDEFREYRRIQEEDAKNGNGNGRMNGNEAMMVDDGFEIVYGKKKKGGRGKVVGVEDSEILVAEGVKVAMKDKRTVGGKAKVPFHIPTIRRPQDEFSIIVNNANVPFEHVWLQRSDDGQKFVHPLEKLSVLDFVDKDPENIVPQKPPSLESTPFKLVEEVKDLKEMAAKLRSVNEFAVDLEHNQYRSFQGLTCLMQISTRTEDFVVDTLKLRIHIGPHLREVFKDPSKRKVMHGADKDIVWLQRDFGIYVCNMFDTGQASKVLKLERNSLEHLLNHFCEITANKEYQNADWRLRPIPDEMLRYAREDTHYLLYIYDTMRINLYSLPKAPESSDTPLVEVYKRSYDVCMQLYEKELLTENSYLHIYGLQGAGFNAQQLAIVSGLCEWRDIVARAEDESTGYVLPNKTVLEIAKQMPVTTNKLRRLVKTKHPYLEHNLDSVVTVIRHSIQNAAAFEAAAQQLKEGNATTASDAVTVTTEDPAPQTQNPKESFQHQDTDVQIKLKPNNVTSELPRESLTIPEQTRDANVGALSTLKGNGATVQVLKKPGGAFGALLGNSASKRKLGLDKKGKEEIKLEQIRSSVTLPFHSFSGGSETSKPVVETPSVADQQKPVTDPASTSALDEIIMLDTDTGVEEDVEQNNNLENPTEQTEKNPSASTSDEDEPKSLSELSANFKKCFQSSKQNNRIRKPKKTEQASGLLQLTPYDYEAAMNHVKFGEKKKNPSSHNCDGRAEKEDASGKKKRSTIGDGQPSDLPKQFQQGRRRAAFPASGNRSATFR